MIAKKAKMRKNQILKRKPKMPFLLKKPRLTGIPKKQLLKRMQRVQRNRRMQKSKQVKYAKDEKDFKECKECKE